MRSRLTKGLAALTLTVAVGMAGTVQPAQAAPPPRPAPEATTMVFDWTSAVIAVASHLLSGDSGAGGAVQQILAAIEEAKNDIIRHVDAIASAEIQGCVEAATIEFANIEFFPPPVLTLWAQRATECATRATAYLQALESPQAVDNIGFIVGQIFAIVFAARAKAGLVNAVDVLLSAQIRSYQAVLAKLGPGPGACVPFRIEGQIEYYTCRAYNGDTGRGYPASVAWDIASHNISEPIARSALPRLVNLLNGG